MSCQVAGCRFNKSHVTSGHKCGRCGRYGHGVIECGEYFENDLSKYLADTLPPEKWCTFEGCKFKFNHTNDAHHCLKCNSRGKHGENGCPLEGLNQDMFPNMSSFLADFDNIYLCHRMGMGCEMYIRKKAGVLEQLFMHSDNWGQYGYKTDHTPIYNDFIEGMVELNTLVDFNFDSNYDGFEYHTIIPGIGEDNSTITVMCPLCRTENTRDNIKKIKGLGEKCIVCYENNVSIYFTDCEHACVCEECYNKL